METNRTYSAFAGTRLIATGPIEKTLLTTKDRLDGNEPDPILIFDDRTGQQVDFDFRGTPDQVLARLSSHPLFASNPPPESVVNADSAKKSPGRPKLGVVSREVSLLPRHWDWLDSQQGGMSATLRRLVEEARKRNATSDSARLARDAAGKFMWAMAGNLPEFEEASRALYAGDIDRLKSLTAPWPEDIRAYLLRLATSQ